MYNYTGQSPYNNNQYAGVKPLQDPPNTQQVLRHAIIGKEKKL